MNGVLFAVMLGISTIIGNGLGNSKAVLVVVDIIVK
jgi:hypothetical protein